MNKLYSNPIEAFKRGRKLRKKTCGGNLRITKALEGIDLEVGPSRAALINQYNADMANKYFEEAKNAPGSGAWQAMKGAYYWLLSKPNLFGESDMITGTAPVDGVLGKVKAVSKATKLAARAAKEDKALGVSKKVKNTIKYGKAYDTLDLRSINSGLSRVKNSLLRLAKELLKDYPEYRKAEEAILKKYYKANNPEVKARLEKEYKELLKKFIEAGLLH